jgi:hypothetical protein
MDLDKFLLEHQQLKARVEQLAHKVGRLEEALGLIPKRPPLELEVQEPPAPPKKKRPPPVAQPQMQG